MTKQEYSLFWNDGWQPNDEDFLSDDLQGFIEECARDYGPPIAWAPEFPSERGRNYETLRAESIAAGRLIEKIDGKWVARGVEEEKVTAFIDGVFYQFGAYTVEVFTQDYLPDPNAAMIARDGPAKPLVSNWIDLSSAPVSTAKPNPFASFRNPDSCAGPADHLNAARHQMAGMKG